MSNIPICRLCECVPSESFDLIDIETMYYNCDTSGCPVAESGMMLTPEQWQQLMGGGEPVMKYTNSPTQCHVEWEKLPYGTHLLYTRPQAAQVDDAVRLLDAAIALRDDLLLRAEMADDGCRVVFAGASVWDEFKKAIDAAMTKEQGNAKSDR